MAKEGSPRRIKSRASSKPMGGSNNTSHTNKNSINDYNYYLGLAKQASSYKTTTEYLINYIKTDNGNNIRTAFKFLEPQ